MTILNFEFSIEKDMNSADIDRLYQQVQNLQRAYNRVESGILEPDDFCEILLANHLDPDEINQVYQDNCDFLEKINYGCNAIR